MAGPPEILSSDPNAGDVLSSDPNAGEPLTSATTAQKPPDSSSLDAIGRAMSEFWTEVNPATQIKGAVGTAANLVGAGQGMLQKQGEPYLRAKAAFDKGDYVEGAIHGLYYLMPIIGPQLSDAAMKGKGGDIAGMIGQSAGIGSNFFVTPKVVGAVAKALPKGRTPSFTTATPEVQAAVKYGQAEGIPVDAATATGNPVVRAGQYLADRSLGGAISGPAAERAQQAALENTSGRLAQQAHPTAVSPEQAGTALRQEVSGKISGYHGEANTAYDTLRTIEAQRPIPVDVSNLKRILQPIRDKMYRQLPVTLRASSPGFNAVEQLLAGPDSVPLSIIDSDLSVIKGMAREADPYLRSTGQGIAAKTAGLMDAEIKNAAAKAGPDALKALEEGRAATRAKYAAADVLGEFADEPVKAFRQATLAKDAGIARLRRLAQQAPDALPQLGRALLDDLFARPGKVQGVGSGAEVWRGAYNDWQNLGPETKQLLFKDPALRQNLDNFFLLAKKMADNPNPSGTGHLVSLGAQGGLFFSHPVLGAVDIAAGYGFSKFFHSPTGVKLLTEGMAMPKMASAARVANWWSRVQQFGAGTKAGLSMAPATAQDQRSTPAVP